MKRLIPLLVCALLVMSAAARADVTLAPITSNQGAQVRADIASGVFTGTRASTTTQLKTRNAAGDAEKSWLQFDLSSIYTATPNVKGHITSALLGFTSATSTAGKGYVINALNDGVNDAWVSVSLTWDTAPGNNLTNGATLNTTQTVNLYTVSDSGATGTVTTNANAANPTTAMANLVAFLNGDSDGKVTFIVTAGGTTYLDYANAKPTLTLTYADVPEPATLAVFGLGGLILRRRLA
jgi:hypothetical protein